jgi:hypothetical protein
MQTALHAFAAKLQITVLVFGEPQILNQKNWAIYLWGWLLSIMIQLNLEDHFKQIFRGEYYMTDLWKNPTRSVNPGKSGQVLVATDRGPMWVDDYTMPNHALMAKVLKSKLLDELIT